MAERQGDRMPFAPVAPRGQAFFVGPCSAGRLSPGFSKKDGRRSPALRGHRDELYSQSISHFGQPNFCDVRTSNSVDRSAFPFACFDLHAIVFLYSADAMD